MKLALSSIFILLFVGFSAAQTANLPRDDNQFWNETQLVVWSNKKNELAINGLFRAGREGLRPTDERIGTSYTHKPSKYLSLTGGYLYRCSQPDRNRVNYESRFIAAGTINLPLAYEFKLADRNQFEFKLRNSRRNTFDYRNRFRIDREITVGGTKITPFGFVEAFYNEKDRWYRSRLAIGLHKQLTKKIIGEIFYLRQNDGITRPGNLNVLGTYLKVHL